VTLRSEGADGLKARVVERSDDSVVVEIIGPVQRFGASELDELVLEYGSPNGRAVLRGASATQDGEDPNLMRLNSLRPLEIVQEREYVRIKSSRPVLVYSARDRSQMQSFTVDVSGGGLLMSGPDALEVGEEVKFRLTLTPGVLPISGTGRVVRTDSQGRGGIVFESISDLDRRRLTRFISECQRAEQRPGAGTDSPEPA
jgi:hypothetical protein